MAKKILNDQDYGHNQILNVRVQNLGSAPSSPVAGQIYYDTGLNQQGYYNGTTWVYAAGGGGDFSSNTATSVDSEVVLFNGTTGKSGKRATSTGIPKLTSGVLSTATSGTDYAPGTSGNTTGLVKSTTSTGALTTAVPGTDYVGPTSGSAIQKANGSGGLTAATASTDYAPATSGSAILKGNGSGGFSSATAGTDYYNPGGTDVAVADGGTGASTLTGVLKGNGTSAVTGSATLTDVGAPTADFSMGSHKITSLTDPSSAQDAATKAYVDAAAAGIDWKASVRAATTGNGTLASAYANGQTIDGVTLATGNRILLKDQTTGTENGIYTVNASGAPTRATDADSSTEVTGGMAVFVEEGTANADTGWVMTNNGAITIGTTALVFVQFTGLGEVTAGAGLSKSGNTISIENSGVLTVPHGGTGVATLTGLVKGNGTSVMTAATPGTDYAAATTGSSVLKGNGSGGFSAAYFSGTIGDGTTTAIGVTHSLGNQYVLAQVYDASSNAQVECDIVLTSSSVTTFTFAVAPASNAYRVVIIG